jgi:hypothetical protein
METLHSVIRTIRGETKSRRDHLTVFREFLNQLDRVSRRAPKREAKATLKGGKGRRGKAR